jgi:hypothetical protein
VACSACAGRVCCGHKPIEDAVLHRVAQLVRQPPIAKQSSQRFIPTGAPLHEVSENHLDPPGDDLNRLIPAVGAEKSDRILDELRYQSVERGILHEPEFTTEGVTCL